MRIQLIFTLLSFMTGCVSSFTVTGYSGGTVIIYCHYNIEEESYWNGFCRQSTERQYSSRCHRIIRAGSQNTWVHSGRFSLYHEKINFYHNTGKNNLKVVIRQLTREDEGTYWCGMFIPVFFETFTRVELEVKEVTDKCCNASETVDLGGESTIICNYPDNHENSIKYFCKEDNDSPIYNEIISAYATSAKSGRFSLTDNRKEKRFTVTISNLTKEDFGTYWCGVENRLNGGHYFSLITEVHLSGIDSTPSPQSATSTLPATSISKSGILLVIIVFGILVVVLFTVSLIIVYKRK